MLFLVALNNTDPDLIRRTNFNDSLLMELRDGIEALLTKDFLFIKDRYNPELIAYLPETKRLYVKTKFSEGHLSALKIQFV